MCRCSEFGLPGAHMQCSILRLQSEDCRLGWLHDTRAASKDKGQFASLAGKASTCRIWSAAPVPEVAQHAPPEDPGQANLQCGKHSNDYEGVPAQCAA